MALRSTKLATEKNARNNNKQKYLMERKRNNNVNEVAARAQE